MKHGEKRPVWLDDFKVALIQDDIDKLEYLASNMPKFETLQQMQEALQLIDNARNKVSILQEQTLGDIKKIKQTISFVKSTLTQNEHKLDIMQ